MDLADRVEALERALEQVNAYFTAPEPDFPAGGADAGTAVAGEEEPPATVPAPKAVRAWARGQGIDVPARGPLPEDVVARYLAAAED